MIHYAKTGIITTDDAGRSYDPYKLSVSVKRDGEWIPLSYVYEVDVDAGWAQIWNGYDLKTEHGEYRIDGEGARLD